MKYTLKSNKRTLYIALSSVVFLTILFYACGIDIVGKVEYKQPFVKAGEYAEFEMKLKATANEELSDKLVVAIHTPKSWNTSKNSEVTYEIKSTDAGVLVPMTVIPDGSSPKNQPGLTWNQALLNKFGGQDPNVLDDMEWVAFEGKVSHTIQNGDDWEIIVRMKVKTGPENLRAKIGFFANHLDDGLSTDQERWDIQWGDCFEVTDGEGDIIDFCEFHFNMATPGQATQNDIITLKYIGDISENDLEDETDIYLCATAYTNGGAKKYEVCERSEKSKMLKESKYGNIYSLTFWSEGYFEVPENEVISSIDYYFTNKDGTKYVSLYDDEHKSEPEENPTWTIKPLSPFIYGFQCKSK